MSDFQKSFSESTSSIKFDDKYIDNSVQPNDIGIANQWAVKTVSDPCVGNLATPVNSGYFTKAFINNLFSCCNKSSNQYDKSSRHCYTN